MEKRITATEAVRKFSELLNSIKFKGVHYVIERGGKPVTSMGPVGEARKIRPLKELVFIFNELPRLNEEVESFVTDLEYVSRHQLFLPRESQWE